jgi:hypothetical protein
LEKIGLSSCVKPLLKEIEYGETAEPTSSTNPPVASP